MPTAAKSRGYDDTPRAKEGLKGAPRERDQAKKKLVRSQRVLGKWAREILGPEAMENPIMQLGLGGLHSVTSKGPSCELP